MASMGNGDLSPVESPGEYGSFRCNPGNCDQTKNIATGFKSQTLASPAHNQGKHARGQPLQELGGLSRFVFTPRTTIRLMTLLVLEFRV